MCWGRVGGERPISKSTTIPTQRSESITYPAQRLEPIVNPVAPMAIRFGDLDIGLQKYCVFDEGFGTLARLPVMAVVRGRPQGLPVIRSRFANLRTTATQLFGDD